jgi:thymidylate synthase (FAD)
MSNVKIVGITKPMVEDYPGMTPEEYIVYVARVSNPSNQLNMMTAPKLMKYLIEHKHWSPMEHCFLTLEITTTRDIGRQILRHRSFTFQEFSQRYADPTQDMNFVTREARLQDHKNRQNSIETDDDDVHYQWKMQQNLIRSAAEKGYKLAIDMGIAKEVARSVLPEGLIETKMYMSGSLRSFIHYIDVRAEEGTQKEHRQVALAAQKEILMHFPSLKEYWYPDLDPNMPRFEDHWLPRNRSSVVEQEPKSWWWKFWS